MSSNWVLTLTFAALALVRFTYVYCTDTYTCLISYPDQMYVVHRFRTQTSINSRVKFTRIGFNSRTFYPAKISRYTVVTAYLRMARAYIQQSQNDR